MYRKYLVGPLFVMLGMLTVSKAQTLPVTAVRAGHLFDSKSGQMLTNQVVLISGERITDVGAADRIQIPSGAQVIDLSQATVMPGLIDAHTHVYSSLSAGAAREHVEGSLDPHGDRECADNSSRGIHHGARCRNPRRRLWRRRRAQRHQSRH